MGPKLLNRQMDVVEQVKMKSVPYNTGNTPFIALHRYGLPAALCTFWGTETQEQHPPPRREPAETWEGGPHRTTASHPQWRAGTGRWSCSSGGQAGRAGARQQWARAVTGCVGRLQSSTGTTELEDLQDHPSVL